MVAVSSLLARSAQQSQLAPALFARRWCAAGALGAGAPPVIAHRWPQRTSSFSSRVTSSNDDQWRWLKDPEHPKLQQYLTVYKLQQVYKLFEELQPVTLTALIMSLM